MKWPFVLSEDETLDRVIAGESLSRFGDGEFNLALGGKCKTQKNLAPIGATLRAILAEGARLQGKLLVAIPAQGIGPKKAFWAHYCRQEVVNLLRLPEYGSSLVTRPDSAPWIDREDYWQKVKSLWEGKRITLVRGSTKSLTGEMLKGAAAVHEVVCPAKNAYSIYGSILDRIADDRRVLLCLGATATILAADLALRGQHAIDLGHVGMFLGKHERGEPMQVTEEDKRVDEYA